MRRIVLMLIRNMIRVPGWMYHIWKLGRPNDTHTEEERYNYLRSIVKRVNKSGRVTVEGSGEDNIPKDNGFIFFPNHQGLFDMLAIIDTCPRPFGVVVKKEASNIILVKQVIELLRGMAIDRKDIRSSLTIINKMTEEVKKGRNYVIFAEGTRSKQENQILEFKGGTFKSAVNAKCPIVPVALVDCYKPFDIPSFNKVNVKVSYLPPIYPEQYMGLKTKEIADIVHNSIQNQIDNNK